MNGPACIAMFRYLLACLLLAAALPAGADTLAAYPENPLVNDSAIYVSADGVAKIEPETGVVWRALAGQQTFEPVLTPGSILLGSSSGLVALSAETGEILWRRFAGSVVFSPVVVGTTAFLAARDGVLRAVDLNSGQVLWRRQFDGWIYPPAYMSRTLVTGGQAARLWGLDPETGRTRWTRAVGQELVYRPVSNGKAVFVTTFAGELMALNPANGRLDWQRTDAVASAAMAADRRSVYLGGMDGVLRQVDTQSGALRRETVLRAGPIRSVVLVHGEVLVTGADRQSDGAFPIDLSTASGREVSMGTTP